MDIVNLFINDSPKITRVLISFTIIINVLVWTGILTPYILYLNITLIIKHFQFWRIFTNFFYLGKLNINLIVNIILLYRNSKQIEKRVFHGDSAEYLFFILFSMFIFILISPVSKIIFYSHSLANAIMYYWGRKCKRVNAAFMGIFTFRAPYLAYIYLVISLLLGYDFKSVFIGIIVGHIYFFFKDILPRIKGTYGIELLKTPICIKKFCDLLKLNNDYIIENDENENIFI